MKSHFSFSWSVIPRQDARVPDIQRKTLSEISSFLPT